jgi:hypothetical protein
MRSLAAGQCDLFDALPGVTLARSGCGVEHFNGQFDWTVERPGRISAPFPGA